MPISTPSSVLARPLTVRRALSLPTLRGSIVLGGAHGLDRLVERLNVMEVPDVLPWVKPRELLLTTADELRRQPDRLTELISELDERELAGIGIKVGRYIDGVPSAMVRAADRLGFPVIRLPDEASFDDILNELLTDILHRQAAVLGLAQRTHNALVNIVLTGGDVPAIVAALGEILEVPVALLDEADEVVVDQAGSPPSALWEHPSIRDSLQRRQPTSRLPDGRHVMLAPILIERRRYGHLVCIAPAASEGDELQALESGAVVAALAISRAAAVEAVEGKYRSDFLHEVVARRVTDPEEIRTRCRAFGWKLERRCVAIVASKPLGIESTSDAGWLQPSSRLERILRADDPDAFAIDLGGDILAVTDATKFDGVARTRLATELDRLAGRSNGGWYAGVSRDFTGPTQLPTAFELATAAAAFGRRTQAARRVTRFDELGIHRLISMIPDGAELRSYLGDVLGPLVGTERSVAELRQSLTVLLEANLNVAEAARQLHCHYNTLRYRIEKLTSMLGPFTTDANVRLNIQVALAVLRTLPPDET